jgi:PAS domain-containing protein
LVPKYLTGGGENLERFILQQNVLLLSQRLAEHSDPALLRTIRNLLAAAQRNLALFEAAQQGATLVPPTVVGTSQWGQSMEKLARLRREFEASQRPYLIVDPRPGLHIVDINDAYAKVTMTERGRIAGERLFDIFPDNPDDLTANGVSNLYKSLQAATETGRPHAMAVQRYDVRDASGEFVVKFWQPVNTPILDERGNLMFIVHHVEDVTEALQAAQRPPRKAAGER